MASQTDDHIHLPNNSWIPLVMAVAISVTLIGLVLVPIVWIAGLVLLIITSVAWIVMARKEFNELPDHEH